MKLFQNLLMMILFSSVNFSSFCMMIEDTNHSSTSSTDSIGYQRLSELYAVTLITPSTKNSTLKSNPTTVTHKSKDDTDSIDSQSSIISTFYVCCCNCNRTR